MRTSCPATSQRSPVKPPSLACWSSSHDRYSVTSGDNAASAAEPSASAPSACMSSTARGGSKVSVFSTSAEGVQVVRSTRQAPSTSSQSAETPWPAASSGEWA